MTPNAEPSAAGAVPDDFLIGIQARVEDAAILAERGRLEGALLMLLVAVAATSRKRYPAAPRKKGKGSKPKGGCLSDHEAFTTFLKDESWQLVRSEEPVVEFRGKSQPIEDFLYEYLRCNLVHEGGLPTDLHPIRDGDVITIEYPDGSAISFSKLLLTRINDVVWKARENSYFATLPEMTKAYERIQRLRATTLPATQGEPRAVLRPT